MYRVDTNLRPRGKDGPIVNTVDSLEHYYEIEGQEWERQALIRVRPVAGDVELGLEFIKRVEPFIFRKSIDISILKKIRGVKLALEKSAETEGWRNIKLGSGGIRELEFFVHALQTLHAGKIPALRVTGTFDAIKLLAKNKIISTKNRDELICSYTFLRRVENILQGENDRQTHTIPKDEGELLTLAKNLGFESVDKFTARLSEERAVVQKAFTGLFEANYEKMEINEAMEANLESCSNDEEIIDSLPWFKRHISKRIQELDLNGKISTEQVFERLTLLAESVICETYRLAQKRMKENYGNPRKSDGSFADLAIIGMGRLGTFEMDYASDLDLIFVYSGDGTSDGPKKIDNHEYFTKLAQYIISKITLPTRYGRAYEIDINLRPSGNQGVLVSSIESFERYHKRESGLWERLYLLRARPVAGETSFINKISALIDELIFDTPLPPNLKEEMDKMRQKVADEKPAPKGQFNLKSGIGGIADIEYFIYHLLLKHGGLNRDIRLKKNSEIIDALANTGILPEKERSELKERYWFFRKILARSRLFSSHVVEVVDPKAEYFAAVATSLGMKPEELTIALKSRVAQNILTEQL
jgi:glutamine synthetase adenylyltransferase